MGDDDELNKILWFSAKGNRPYPSKFSKKILTEYINNETRSKNTC